MLVRVCVCVSVFLCVREKWYVRLYENTECVDILALAFTAFIFSSSVQYWADSMRESVRSFVSGVYDDLSLYGSIKCVHSIHDDATVFFVCLVFFFIPFQ